MNIILKKEEETKVIKPKKPLILLLFIIPSYLQFLLILLLIKYIYFGFVELINSGNIDTIFPIITNKIFLYNVLIFVLGILILIILFKYTKKNKQIKGIFINVNLLFIFLTSSWMIFTMLFSFLGFFLSFTIYPIIKIYFVVNIAINANKYELNQYLKDGYNIVNYDDLNDKEKKFIKKAKKRKRPSYLYFKF